MTGLGLERSLEPNTAGLCNCYEMQSDLVVFGSNSVLTTIFTLTFTFSVDGERFFGSGRILSCHMIAAIGQYGRSGRSVWRPTNPHACLPFRRRACFDDRACALLVPGTSPEKPLCCPVSRPRSTKIAGGQFESEAQPLAVPIVSDWYQRRLKIGTVWDRLRDSCISPPAFTSVEHSIRLT